jgi:hypothetical protein
MTMNKAKFQEVIESTTLLNDHIDFAYMVSDDGEQFASEDELREYLQERVYEQEIIYYTNAAKYLLENDPSLTESLELAQDMGFDMKSLNSEKLATLHLQQKLSEELAETDFSECFEESGVE